MNQQKSYRVAGINQKGDYYSGAIFSECEYYRYAMWRIWVNHLEPAKRPNIIMFIGLNPSTADETKNDPTVTRCIGFAKKWGYDGLFMMNIFALRSTEPRMLYNNERSPIGLLNHLYLQRVGARSALAVCCWGNHGELHSTGNDTINNLKYIVPLYMFGKTKQNEPKHPLYLKSDSIIKPLDNKIEPVNLINKATYTTPWDIKYV